MLKTNWHTHTNRCGHAVGTDEEYVIAAIQAGIKTLGFSDHAAYHTPRPRSRMDFELKDDYFSSIRSLKEKYRDQITLYLGMECEYFESEWETLSRYRKDLDYIILGQHDLWLDGPDVYHPFTSDQVFEYVDLIEKACSRNFCDYVAHPDVFMWGYPGVDDTVRQAASRLADISVKYNIPMELNCGSGVKYGMREFQDGMRYAYPVRIFFEEFAKKNCPVIVGLDIHDPKLFMTDEYVDRALSVCEGLDINFLWDFDLVSAAKERKQQFR
ncbi:MAG: histidinol-phosphatase [Solobacterium sp.]|nr:histidinol-phosphatase [Solobacterium sp.]